MKKNSTQTKSCQKLGSVGGQALIEGIMMRGPKGVALSVRQPDGTINTEKKDFKMWRDKHKILGVPLIRGVVSYIESMVIGYKCMVESAEKSGLDDMEESEEPSKFEKFILDHFGDKLFDIVMTVGTVLGIALAIVLFMWMPSVIFDLINNVFDGRIDTLRAIIEGIMRIGIFIGYIAAVSLMKDIRRTFEYHGAEHKTIFCYEAGLELTVENVEKQSRFHPRCGTSFLFVIMIISIAISSILSIFTPLSEVRIVWIITKILILPIVMAIGYEFIRYAGRHNNLFTKIVSAPGLWMQRLTTKNPHPDQIEVAIAALEAVVESEHAEAAEKLESEQAANNGTDAIEDEEDHGNGFKTVNA